MPANFEVQRRSNSLFAKFGLESKIFLNDLGDSASWIKHAPRRKRTSSLIEVLAPNVLYVSRGTSLYC